MRALRLLIGVAIIIQSIVVRDIIFVIVGFLFAGMAVMNVGCCGTSGCTIVKKNDEPIKETRYEEVA